MFEERNDLIFDFEEKNDLIFDFEERNDLTLTLFGKRRIDVDVDCYVDD